MTTFPVEKGFYVTSTFGDRRGGFHWGTDFGREGGSAGYPVFAVKNGTVTRSGPASGFGSWVTVDHPASNGGGETIYGHILPEVIVGQSVSEGQRIATINPDRNSNGGVAPHLHFEWHRYSWSQPGANRLDPQKMLHNARWVGDPEPEQPNGLTAEILARVMGCSVERAAQMLPGYLGAMAAADINSVERAAMFAAQIGHESVGLQYMEEIASGAAYEGRADLGNFYAGDGVRFKGSGPIQLTGRNNFRRFTQWVNSQGISDIDFEAHPELVRQDPRWGFLAASWYWTQARPQINELADAGDLAGVTRAINGGLNGIDDRRIRYHRALALGEQLLPGKDELGMASLDDIRRIVREEVAAVTHDVKRLAIQVGADADDDGFGRVPGWSQGGNRALYDLASAIGVAVGVPRTADTLPEAPEAPRNPRLEG